MYTLTKRTCQRIGVFPPHVDLHLYFSRQTQEEMAQQIAQMIISDVTSATGAADPAAPEAAEPHVSDHVSAAADDLVLGQSSLLARLPFDSDQS